MSVSSERIRASRISDNVGVLLIVVGVIGFLAASVLTGWIIHDLDSASGDIGRIGTVSKLQTVALVGLTPGMLSLLVIAFGVYLQTRSTELLFGVAVDSDLFPDEDDEDLSEPS
jgi:hypothetical protein